MNDDINDRIRRRWAYIAGAAVLAGTTAGVATALPDSWFTRGASTAQSDPEVNHTTGLSDGAYQMRVKSQLNQDGRCSFTGPVNSPETRRAATVTVTSSDPAVCGSRRLLARPVNLVRFVVTDGVATIEETLATVTVTSPT